MVWKCVSNRQNVDWFANVLCDQNNGTMGAEPRVRCTLTRRNNHLLINLWFLSQYLMKFNDIFHKYKAEHFWFDGIIFVPLIRTEVLHFSGISLGGWTLGTPVYFTALHFFNTLGYTCPMLMVSDKKSTNTPSTNQYVIINVFIMLTSWPQIKATGFHKYLINAESLFVSK